MNLRKLRPGSKFRFLLSGFVAIFALVVCSVSYAADPLPSWKDGPRKKAILEFVAAVTEESGKDYVPHEARIATFDNDRTLWVEAPLYTQILFAFERVKAMAPDHPEWKDKPALRAVMDGDLKAVARVGKKGVVEILMITHAGMTTEEFAKAVSDWIASAECNAPFPCPLKLGHYDAAV